jgi:lipopolysaccharide assembly outer membrane protein LptD (OstA)
MKLLAPAASITCLICVFVSHGVSQNNPAQRDRLHINRPFPDSTPGRVELTASSIQRDLSSRRSESILQLQGNVEVRMITCGPTDHDSHLVCDKGSMVLRADRVDYNENTGEIHARGDVRIAPYRTRSTAVK